MSDGPAAPPAPRVQPPEAPKKVGSQSRHLDYRRIVGGAGCFSRRLRSATGFELLPGWDGVDQKKLGASPTTAQVEPSDPPSSENSATTTTVASVFGKRSEPLGMGTAATVKWDTFGDADGSVWNTPGVRFRERFA